MPPVSSSFPLVRLLLHHCDSFFGLSLSFSFVVVRTEERDEKRRITLKLSLQPWPTEPRLSRASISPNLFLSRDDGSRNDCFDRRTNFKNRRPTNFRDRHRLYSKKKSIFIETPRNIQQFSCSFSLFNFITCLYACVNICDRGRFVIWIRSLFHVVTRLATKLWDSVKIVLPILSNDGK